jgi:hypothetical protein
VSREVDSGAIQRKKTKKREVQSSTPANRLPQQACQAAKRSFVSEVGMQLGGVSLHVMARKRAFVGDDCGPRPLVRSGCGRMVVKVLLQRNSDITERMWSACCDTILGQECFCTINKFWSSAATMSNGGT